MAAGVADGVLIGESTGEVVSAPTAVDPMIRTDFEDGMYILVPKLAPTLGMCIKDNLQIRACGQKMVLDLANGLFDEGTDIRVYQANQTDAQKWMLVKVNVGD